MKKFIYIFITVIIFTTFFIGCSTKEATPDNNKLNVTATIFPEYDFARAIAADKANISMMIAPGASVHSFDPSPSDIIKIQKSDVFIYIGGESDVWVDNILDSLDKSSMKIVRLMDYLTAFEEEIKEGMEHEEDEHEKDGHSHENEEEDEKTYDEHIWTSPKNAVKLIEIICSAMIEKDIANTAFYTENAQRYKEEIENVDKEIEDVIANAKHKKIIVADKFPFLYFTKHYGLEYEAAFPGCSDQSDAGAKTIASLINAVKNEKISCVYHVELSNKSVASAIAEQTGAKILLLNSCHNVSKTDFDKGVTYLSLMKDNIENLREGLN